MSVKKYLEQREKLYQDVYSLEKEFEDFDYYAHHTTKGDLDLMKKLYIAQHRLKYFELAGDLIID